MYSIVLFLFKHYSSLLIISKHIEKVNGQKRFATDESKRWQEKIKKKTEQNRYLRYDMDDQIKQKENAIKR